MADVFFDFKVKDMFVFSIAYRTSIVHHLSINFILLENFPVKILNDFCGNFFHFFGIIMNVIAEKYIEIQLKIFRPGMNTKMRFFKANGSCKAFVFKNMARSSNDFCIVVFQNFFRKAEKMVAISKQPV